MLSGGNRKGEEGTLNRRPIGDLGVEGERARGSPDGWWGECVPGRDRARGGEVARSGNRLGPVYRGAEGTA